MVTVKTLNCEWSDGTKFVLFESQQWEDKVTNDYTIEIVKINDEFVTIKFLETGKCYDHELDGNQLVYRKETIIIWDAGTQLVE